MKVCSVITKPVSRYLLKNTTYANYNRNLDCATASAFVLGIECTKFPHWEEYDVPLTATFSALFIKSFSNILKNKIALRPIIKRAKQIKLASKL